MFLGGPPSGWYRIRLPQIKPLPRARLCVTRTSVNLLNSQSNPGAHTVTPLCHRGRQTLRGAWWLTSQTRVPGFGPGRLTLARGPHHLLALLLERNRHHRDGSQPPWRVLVSAAVPTVRRAGARLWSSDGHDLGKPLERREPSRFRMGHFLPKDASCAEPAHPPGPGLPGSVSAARVSHANALASDTSMCVSGWGLGVTGTQLATVSSCWGQL